jgi:hypothetical protein
MKSSGWGTTGSTPRPNSLCMSTTAAEQLELEDLDAESERVLLWREEELARVGYERETARDLAERIYVDLHLAMDLLRRGCPADTAVRILL